MNSMNTITSRPLDDADLSATIGSTDTGPVAAATTVASAFAMSGNKTPEQIAQLFTAIYAAVLNTHVATIEEEPRKPAVPINKSVTPDFIICLDDGKKFKSLKRHLMSEYGLTPEQYRERWGLKPDYPMVAPGYSARRSELAKEHGLGRK